MGKKIQNNLPFVSIVVPCRNEEKYIGKCLDSLIYNDYPKNLIEIFVIDGMSEDSTKGIVEKYIEKYPFSFGNDNEKVVNITTPATDEAKL